MVETVEAVEYAGARQAYREQQQAYREQQQAAEARSSQEIIVARLAMSQRDRNRSY